MRVILNSLWACLAVVLCSLLYGEAAAFAQDAAIPWWHVVASTAPTNLPPGGIARVLVSASNVGDGEADPSGSPIVLSDVLPAGVEAIGITSQAGYLGLWGEDGQIACSLEKVSCTFRSFNPKRGGKLPAYMDVEMALTVRVSADAVSGTPNEAVVEGGGAARDVRRQPFTISSAATSFGVEWFEMVPEGVRGVLDTQAGSHPFQLTTTLDLNQDLKKGRVESPALVRDLSFQLPAGLVGNPTAVPRCTAAEFNEMEGPLTDGCPATTAVGVAKVTLVSETQLPVTIPVPLFNLVPDRGEPARFGFFVYQVPVTLDTLVRTGSDYGVTVTVPTISQAKDLLSSQVTFWGDPSDPRHDQQRGWRCLAPTATPGSCETPSEPHAQPFLTLPTSCSLPWTPTVTADSWDQPGAQLSAQYSLHDVSGYALGLSGCGRLTFEPQISVTPDGQAASSPTGLTVGIHVPQTAGLNPTGDAQSSVKSITVALPEGETLNPAGADGLQACSQAQVGFTGFAEYESGVRTPTFTSSLPEPLTPGVNFCPEASKIATVTIHTPLLPDPLKGSVYLAEQVANPFGSLVAMYLVARDPVSGVLVKLAGEVSLSETGQVTATFANPPLPFEDAELEFFGGSRAPLGTPPACGSYTAVASIAPWSGNQPAQITSAPFEVLTGPDGSRATCEPPLPFMPVLTAGSPNIQAGAFTPFTMTMSRQDGNQDLEAIQLKMPPGLLGMLSGVQLCDEAQANAGTCGPASLIGETTVSVGLGGNPLTVKGGNVYITGPYEGAPYGLSIVNPAKAGPFDLGRVVVRARIEVDRDTAALTITSDTMGPYKIPQIIDGIPLQIKHVNVTINRPVFTFNPTNCQPMRITGSLTSSQQATATPLAVPFQVTNCATLKFKPKLQVTTSGKTSRTRGASLDVKLTYPKAPFGTQTNISYVKVSLPKQLPSRLSTLQKACADTVFNQNPAACPVASRVGSATATTPVLPVRLQGPAYFVSHGGRKFPELIIVISGYGTTVYLHGETFISKQGITSSTFHQIPDVPVGEFHLTLPQNPNSALAANGNLCSRTVTVHKRVNGRLRTLHKRVPVKLVMPTSFTAQNGAVLKQNTKIAVSGCPKKGKSKKK